MGDRAIVVLKKEVMTDGVTHTLISPQMYLHWNGSPNNVSTYIDKLAETMEGRRGDLSYAFARLVGIAHEDIEGNLSLGVYSNDFKDDDIYDNVSRISHGDNGVYVVENWEIVDREFNPGQEQQEYDFNEMVAEIRSKNDQVFGYEEKANG